MNDKSHASPAMTRRTFLHGAAAAATSPWWAGAWAPSEGLQFFGAVHIDGRGEAMTVSLHNAAGERLYRVELEPTRAAR